jgi:hypothetical protein
VTQESRHLADVLPTFEEVASESSPIVAGALYADHAVRAVFSNPSLQTLVPLQIVRELSNPHGTPELIEHRDRE